MDKSNSQEMPEIVLGKRGIDLRALTPDENFSIVKEVLSLAAPFKYLDKFLPLGNFFSAFPGNKIHHLSGETHNIKIIDITQLVFHEKTPTWMEKRGCYLDVPSPFLLLTNKQKFVTAHYNRKGTDVTIYPTSDKQIKELIAANHRVTGYIIEKISETLIETIENKKSRVARMEDKSSRIETILSRIHG